jgi:hypothetical protein
MDLISKIVFGLNLHRNLRFVAKLGTLGRPKPVLFIAGFQKSGTTSIYQNLMDSGFYVQPHNKEDNRLALNSENIIAFQYGFPYSLTNSRSVCASHLFTYIPNSISTLRRFYPNAKILLIVREPISRALSHFDMDKRFGWIPESITAENWFEFELETLLKAKVDFQSIESVYKSFNLFNWRFGTPLVRSIYFPYIKEFISQGFPVHVVELNELNTGFEVQMNRIYDFLEMPNKHRTASGKMTVENKASQKSTISDELNLRLSEFYREPNSLLFELLSKKYNW